MTSLTPEQRAEKVARFELVAHSPAEWFAMMANEIREAERAARRKAMEECAEIAAAEYVRGSNAARAIRSRMAQEEDAEAGEAREAPSDLRRLYEANGALLHCSRGREHVILSDDMHQTLLAQVHDEGLAKYLRALCENAEALISNMEKSR